jgi:hypothetical protein
MYAHTGHPFVIDPWMVFIYFGATSNLFAVTVDQHVDVFNGKIICDNNYYYRRHT